MDCVFGNDSSIIFHFSRPLKDPDPSDHSGLYLTHTDEARHRANKNMSYGLINFKVHTSTVAYVLSTKSDDARSHLIRFMGISDFSRGLVAGSFLIGIGRIDRYLAERRRPFLAMLNSR